MEGILVCDIKEFSDDCRKIVGLCSSRFLFNSYCDGNQSELNIRKKEKENWKEISLNVATLHKLSRANVLTDIYIA